MKIFNYLIILILNISFSYSEQFFLSTSVSNKDMDIMNNIYQDIKEYMISEDSNLFSKVIQETDANIYDDSSSLDLKILSYRAKLTLLENENNNNEYISVLKEYIDSYPFYLAQFNYCNLTYSPHSLDTQQCYTKAKLLYLDAMKSKKIRLNDKFYFDLNLILFFLGEKKSALSAICNIVEKNNSIENIIRGYYKKGILTKKDVYDMCVELP